MGKLGEWVILKLRITERGAWCNDLAKLSGFIFHRKGAKVQGVWSDKK